MGTGAAGADAGRAFEAHGTSPGQIYHCGQFTWSTFEVMMDPTCKKPAVEFTYNVDGMAPPLDNVPSDLVARVKVSASDTSIVGVYVIQSQVRGSSDHNDD